MKKKKLFLLYICIVVLFFTLPFAHAQKSGEIEVVFLSPEKNAMWVGKQQIKIRLKNVEPMDVQVVELYLDGRLLKEFSTPPYTLIHQFGSEGQNRILKVVVRGEGFKVLAQGEQRSFQVDDAHKIEVKQVVVPVVVKDKEGNYVRGLKKEDFLLLADDKPREISYFNTSGTAQFNIAQVIDLSGSMRYKIHAVLQAARNFMEKLMTKNDRGTFVFFNHIVFDHLGFTSDLNELNERLDLKSSVEGETALFDAIAYTLNLTNKIPGWNIIVVFSDGQDNSSYIDRYSLIKKVKKSAVVIYAIDNSLDKSEDLLGEICSLSGGKTFPLDSVKKTKKVYDKIREDIKAQYVLYFDAKTTGSRKTGHRFHPLTVKVKNHNYEIRTLKGYY